MTAASPWILGLDLGPRSHGALVLAAWLRAGGARVHGLHVLEAWASRFVAGADDLVASVTSAVAGRCDRLGVAPLEQVHVVTAPRAEDGLLQAGTGAAGLVIGRAAASGERRTVRLGRVARRLLRQLPGPVIVVPPDLEAVAAGPVLLATDLGPASAAATTFAVDLARAHGRGLEVVHVGEPRHNDLIDDLDPDWQKEREIYRGGVQAGLDAWAAGLGLGDRPRWVRFGDAAEEIAGVAAERQAALVVTGSRHLGAAARLFSNSTASALAGLAGCPVAVVPPG